MNLPALPLPGCPGYALLPLSEVHAEALQDLLERCLDFNLLVEGRPPQPGEGAALLHDLPPGKTPEDKFILGVFQGETLAGVLEGSRGYPREGVWWVGLFLLDPAQRRAGLGRRVMQAFFQAAQDGGASEVRLGVVEENAAGLAFWQRLGFELIDTRPPMRFGNKEQRVWVMGRFFGKAQPTL